MMQRCDHLECRLVGGVLGNMQLCWDVWGHGHFLGLMEGPFCQLSGVWLWFLCIRESRLFRDLPKAHLF